MSDPGSFQERLSRSSSWGGGGGGGGGRLSQDRADEYCRPTGSPPLAPLTALDSPEGRKPVQRMPNQRVDSKPVLGGLHHEYRWTA